MTLELTVEIYAKEGNDRFHYQGGREKDLAQCTDQEILAEVHAGIEAAKEWAERTRLLQIPSKKLH